MMFNRQEVVRALGSRFPCADLVQLRAFVDSGYDGDIDENLFDAMAAAWIEGQTAQEGPAVYCVLDVKSSDQHHLFFSSGGLVDWAPVATCQGTWVVGGANDENIL